MVEANKLAKVVPNNSTWNEWADATPLPGGVSTIVPIAKVPSGNQVIERNGATVRGKAFVPVENVPSGSWTILPLVETNGPTICVNVGAAPYDNGVVVLFV